MIANDFAVILNIHPLDIKQLLKNKNESPLDADKQILVRKSGCALNLPVIVYICCGTGQANKNPDHHLWVSTSTGERYYGNGKIIGEFICTRIDVVEREEFDQKAHNEYVVFPQSYNTDYPSVWHGRPLVTRIYHRTKPKTVYLWHINDVCLYDTPIEYKDFRTCSRNERGEIEDVYYDGNINKLSNSPSNTRIVHTLEPSKRHIESFS